MRAVPNYHHDGHGLNDTINIISDEIGAGGAAHHYLMTVQPNKALDPIMVAEVNFQHGALREPGSTPGVTSAAIMAMMLDHFEGFQAGPFACPENALVIGKLKDALSIMKQRADERARRGVLGKNEK